MDGDEANTELIRAINHLLDDSSVSSLNTSLDSLFREYLTSFEEGVFPLDYHQVVNDYYFLIDFLSKLRLNKF